MSAASPLPQPVIDTSVPSANAQNVPQSTDDRPLSTVTSDGSDAIATPASNTEGLSPPTPRSPVAGLNATGTPSLNIQRKESAISFSKVGAANGRDAKAVPEPLIEEATATDLDNASPVDDTERTPRKKLGRKGTFDGRSMVSASSAMTVAEAQTRYVNMLLALDHIHVINEGLAFVFCWLLLAGFVVLPGTIKKTIPDIVQENVQDEALKKALNLVIEHVPLVAVAGGVSAFGLIGMVAMWIRWRGNYIWLVRNIFLPGCTNALAGLVSTLVSIFVLNKGELDTLSIVILSVVGGVTAFNFVMIMVYQFLLLGGLQREHKRLVGKHSAGKTGAGRYKGYDGEYGAGER